MTNARLHSKFVREDLESMGSREVYQFVNQFSPVEIVEVEEEEEEKEKLVDMGNEGCEECKGMRCRWR